MTKHPKIRVARHTRGGWIVDWWERKPDGTRKHVQIRKATQDDAQAVAVQQRAKWREADQIEKEEQRIELSAAKRGDNVVFLAALAPLDKLALVQAMEAMRAANAGAQELVEAAKEWIRRHRSGCKMPLCELVSQHLAWIATARRPATVDDRKKTLRTLTARFGDKAVSQIGTPELRAWVEDGNGDSTRKARRRAASALWGWAMGQGLVEDNPASRIRVAESTRERREVPIFSADDAAKILDAAEEHCPALVPYYAIGFFVGARPISELLGISAADIDLDRGVMVIRSNKTGRSRLAPITPNLRSWLEAYPVGSRGVLWSKRLHKRVIAKAGVRWIQDGMRHTRASFRLAAGIHAGQVAEEDGHSVAILNAHYATRIIKKEDVAKFWALVPTRPRAGADARQSPRLCVRP